MRHPELPVVSFLSIILLFCSLPSHIRAGSVATVSMIAWLAVVNLIRGVNALVWTNNVTVRLEVWCDITTKITVGFTYAIPAAALCVLRHLESVSSTRNSSPTKADKRRRQKFEAVMCLGLPMIGMALHYVVQGHRLDLIEDFGCYPPVYFSVAAIMILWVPPFAMSLITFTYAALALRHFLRHRIEFAAHLRNSQSAITPARYFRLMAMAVIEMVWDTGVNAYLIYFNSFTGLRSWTTWDDVHSNFSRVAIFPEFLIPPQFVTQLIWQWWIVPISSILFFIFFGFGEEAMSDYRAAITWFRQTMLRHKIDKSRPYGTSLMLPTHLPRTTNPPHINKALPMNSNELGEAKEWEELRLEIPETKEDTPPAFVASRPSSFADHKTSISLSHNTTSRSISLDISQRSMSLYSSDSSTAADGPSNPPSPTRSLALNVPALNITRPVSEISYSSPSVVHSVTPVATQATQTQQRQNPAMRLDLSPTSQESIHPGSLYSDLAISISPTYFPEANASPHEYTFHAQDPPHSQHHGGGVHDDREMHS